MKKELQELPLSIQSFEKIRTNNYLYVDKTEDIFKLVKTEKSYFLSRPRRFGKSLLISTLENIFKGNKELFKDLYIYDKWDGWNENYPIIRIDFTNLIYGTVDDLKKSLNIFLTKIAKENNITLEYEKCNGKFGELIKGLKLKHGKKVVVLIDEYDKPILDNISNFEVRDGMKDVLHDFYQILKGQDDNLRFVFLTGVSKFVGTSIFSGFNSPDDLTLDKEFATICGYTQKELEYYFKDHILAVSEEYDVDAETILENIKSCYNGYSWDGQNFVYNPHSTLSLFRKKEFNNYWFGTGTPTFLIKLLKDGNNNLNKIFSTVSAKSEISDSYDPDNIPIIPLMFQSGYLTIKKKERKNLSHTYILSIPNKEVKSSIIRYMMNMGLGFSVDQIEDLRERMRKNIINKDSNRLNLNLQEMFAQIPYNLYDTKEKYYHSIFIVWFYLLGFKVDGEVITSKGQMDAVIIIDNEAIIIEIKYGKNKNKLDNLVEKALTQIIDNKYYEKYLKHDLYSLGIAFADKEIKSEFREINI
jgi:hypothetical protein